MPKVKLVINCNDEEYGWSFYCPGCKFLHIFHTHNAPNENRPIWIFNGNIEKPTFTTSLKCWYAASENMPAYCCHSIVTDGKIIFQNDCTHDLKGQTVEMVDIT